MLSVLTFFLSAVYVIACLFLIFVVLIQKGEGGGLGGLAGGGAVDVAFGAKADMTWKRATGVAAAIFVVLSLVLGVLERPRSVTEGKDASPSPKPGAPSPGSSGVAPPGSNTNTPSTP
jgi:preprotein translocase subunit SecG